MCLFQPPKKKHSQICDHDSVMRVNDLMGFFISLKCEKRLYINYPKNRLIKRNSAYEGEKK